MEWSNALFKVVWIHPERDDVIYGQHLWGCYHTVYQAKAVVLVCNKCRTSVEQEGLFFILDSLKNKSLYNKLCIMSKQLFWSVTSVEQEGFFLILDSLKNKSLYNPQAVVFVYSSQLDEAPGVEYRRGFFLDANNRNIWYLIGFSQSSLLHCSRCRREVFLDANNQNIWYLIGFSKRPCFFCTRCTTQKGSLDANICNKWCYIHCKNSGLK